MCVKKRPLVHVSFAVKVEVNLKMDRVRAASPLTQRLLAKTTKTTNNYRRGHLGVGVLVVWRRTTGGGGHGRGKSTVNEII